MAHRSALVPEFRPITLEDMQAASSSDPIAVSVVAAALARDWCNRFGGESDKLAMMKQVYVARPEARKMLAALMAMPRPDRIALANYIRGTARS